ncbi:hypothetical protein V6N11_021923 [Hibiscus sabdariffa]|uniref:Uncharacterized protein n=1 Tax=Hibiscus sabdariffa TaxID=183260 RepID=A0ABR2THM9_9ROSI
MNSPSINPKEISSGPPESISCIPEESKVEISKPGPLVFISFFNNVQHLFCLTLPLEPIMNKMFDGFEISLKIVHVTRGTRVINMCGMFLNRKSNLFYFLCNLIANLK